MRVKSRTPPLHGVRWRACPRACARTSCLPTPAEKRRTVAFRRPRDQAGPARALGRCGTLRRSLPRRRRAGTSLLGVFNRIMVLTWGLENSPWAGQDGGFAPPRRSWAIVLRRPHPASAAPLPAGDSAPEGPLRRSLLLDGGRGCQLSAPVHRAHGGGQPAGCRCCCCRRKPQTSRPSRIAK